MRVSALILILSFASVTALAEEGILVDESFFSGCKPVVGEVSCEGQVFIARDGGYGLDSFPNNIVGLPQGRGHDDPQKTSKAILSLGNGGYITFKMKQPVRNLEGADLRVFENPFYRRITESTFNPHFSFTELAYVEVSQDGVDFHRFPVSLPKLQNEKDAYSDPYTITNFAGVFPVYANARVSAFGPQKLDANGMRILGEGPGGDDFDLSSLPVSLEWIQYVRIVDAGLDVRDVGLAYDGAPSAGFDLDAVVGLH